MRTRSLVLVLLLGLGGVAAADLAPGEVRAVQARTGVAARKEPKALAASAGLLPYRTRVTVDEVRYPWARVTADGGITGWVRVSDLVEPGSLTSPEALAAASSREASGSSSLSLAGRQFDETTEGDLKATDADLARAYPLVDALERLQVRPDDPALLRFLVEGHLGTEGK